MGKSVILSISSFAPIVLTLVFLSFCPVLLTLKPGEHIHIGKSRIHAFRKVDFKETLDANDCHCEMRKELKIMSLTVMEAIYVFRLLGIGCSQATLI